MAISNRLPKRQQTIQVYAVIVLMIYSWTILWLFWKLPSWRNFLTAWEIAGAGAFSLVTALLESLIVLFVFLLAALCLPRTWFSEVFAARGSGLAAAGLGYMMFVGDKLKYAGLYPNLDVTPWVLALPLPAVALIVYAAGRLAWLRRAAESFADRATIFVYIMLPLSALALLVVMIRLLAQG